MSRDSCYLNVLYLTVVYVYLSLNKGEYSIINRKKRPSTVRL